VIQIKTQSPAALKLPHMSVLLRLRIVLGCLAIAALQAWLPVGAYARMAGPDGLTVEICTPQGLKKLALDAEGSPVESPPGTGQSDHCPLCAASPAPTSAQAPSCFAAACSRTGFAGATHRPAQAPQAPTPPPTGPPALS
jgi:hypothetical protein